jgi:tRNA (adenine22-N1)-methyltransferase
MSLTIGEQYGGVALLHDPLEDRYLIEWIIRMQRAVAGLNHSSEPGDRRKADQLREIIAALLSMREEWRDANSRTN